MPRSASNRLHRFGVGLLAGTGAVAIAALTTPGLAAADSLSDVIFGGPVGDPYACMAEDVFGCAIVYGGSGIPIPHQNYVDAVNGLFIQPDHPGFTPQVLFTPENLYPFTGVKQLPLDESVAQGLVLVDAALKQQLAAGHDVDLYGYSQSATIDTLEMRNLLALPPDERPSPDQLSFTLLGNPNNPDGGLLQIFDLPALQDADGNGPTIPSLGITFSGATPDSIYPTTIYTLEYDGFADFPRYPINLLADLNAVAGISYVHDQYPVLTQGQLDDAITLPTEGPTNTVYKMIETADLPLLEPLRGTAMGNAVADLLQPDLRVLINLGYGSIDHGWDSGPANVPTTFGLFPTNINPADVLTALTDGTQQGIRDFMKDLGSPSLPDMSEAAADSAGGAGDSLPSFTDIVNAFSSALASAYAALLPTADIANALFTTLPTYSAEIFLSELQDGDLLDAFGMPIAATTGLGSLAAGFELISIEHAIAGISANLSSIMP
jgi:hypothetical protein